MLAAQRAAAAKLLLAHKISRVLASRRQKCFNEWRSMCKVETPVNNVHPQLALPLLWSSSEALAEMDADVTVYLGKSEGLVWC